MSEYYTVRVTVPVTVRFRNVKAETEEEAASRAMRSFDPWSYFHKRLPVVGNGECQIDRNDAADASHLCAETEDTIGLGRTRNFHINWDGVILNDKPALGVDIRIKGGRIIDAFSSSPEIKYVRMLNEDVIGGIINEILQGTMSLSDKSLDNRMSVMVDKTGVAWKNYKGLVEKELNRCGWHHPGDLDGLNLDILHNNEWWQDMKETLPRGPKQPTEMELYKAEQERRKAGVGHFFDYASPRVMSSKDFTDAIRAMSDRQKTAALREHEAETRRRQLEVDMALSGPAEPSPPIVRPITNVQSVARIEFDR